MKTTARRIPITPELRQRYEFDGPLLTSIEPASVLASHAAGLGWHVGHCYDKCEAKVIEAFAEQGFDCYAPRLRIQRRYAKGNRHVIHVMMFPGYVFVEFDPARPPSANHRRYVGFEGFVPRVGSPGVAARLADGALWAIARAERTLQEKADQDIGLVHAYNTSRRANKALVRRLGRKGQRYLTKDGVWRWLEKELLEAQPERWLAVLMKALGQQAFLQLAYRSER